MTEHRPARRLGLIAALTCAVSAVAPGLASATTVSVDRECYRPHQDTRVTGEGYTPGGEVELSFNIFGAGGGLNSSSLYTEADGGGRIDMPVRGPVLPPGESPADVHLLATDLEAARQGDPPPVSTNFTLENLKALVSPWNRGIGNPRRRARLEMAGFTLETGRTAYLHYIFHGRLRRTVALGTLKGPCGELSKTIRQFPFRPMRAGIWSIKVDTSRHYPNQSVGRMYRYVRVSAQNAMLRRLVQRQSSEHLEDQT